MVRSFLRSSCALLLLEMLVVGCPKRQEDARRDEVPTPTPSVSASASATTNASVVGSASSSSAAVSGGLVSVTCNDGRLVRHEIGETTNGDAFGFGGLGLGGGGDAGSGEGIGLGTIGGLGHGADAGGPIGMKPSGGSSMSGTSKITAGRIDVDKTDAALCDSFFLLRPCFTALNKASTMFTGNAILTVVVTADGHVDSVATKGSIADPPLIACVEPIVKSLSLPAPTGGATATIEYTIDYTRRPGVSVRMTDTGTTVSGGLPPEVVRRIVRANFPRLRSCYELGKKTDPALAGTVYVDFVIDGTGAIETATLAKGGTLTEASATGCMVGVFRTLAFPEPEKGKVTVHYGVEFSAW